MDDGESGMKEPPVIVQILFKGKSAHDLAHTVMFSRKELCPFFLVHVYHPVRIIGSIVSHRAERGMHRHTSGRIGHRRAGEAGYNDVLLVGWPRVWQRDR